ncbi:hypothetical protein [Thalassobacillus cyri]|uniref:hypothetical protein n=1 Tax=Thalassobacillus cyri TaxID=571932 RepID=UPI001C40B151|nr:hypothetical protein [Thalassobacillus cyri]
MNSNMITWIERYRHYQRSGMESITFIAKILKEAIDFFINGFFSYLEIEFYLI